MLSGGFPFFQSLGVILLPIERPLEFGEQVFQTFSLLRIDCFFLLMLWETSLQGTLSFAGSNMTCESNSNMHRFETW